VECGVIPAFAHFAQRMLELCSVSFLYGAVTSPLYCKFIAREARRCDGRLLLLPLERLMIWYLVGNKCHCGGVFPRKLLPGKVRGIAR
jgi:hypothetical protein